MKRTCLLLSILIMLLGLSVSVQAALVDMNDGTIYDTDTQLSWLKDANTVGYMGWDQAVTWAASLNNGGGFAGLTGWRLPATTQPDATCDKQLNAGGGFPLQGYGYFCTNSEMGYLYYVSLGNSAGGPLTNTGPFTNLQDHSYWSGAEYAPDTIYAWNFYFFSGNQVSISKDTSSYAWAVRPGARSIGNQPPVADAGGDQAVYTGDPVYLNGTATDAENDPILLWSWAIVSAPDAAVWQLLNGEYQNAIFQAFTPGRYLATLMVDDGFGTSAPDTIAITVADNLPPVAIATADKTEGPAPLTVQFDGSQSYDPEGKPLAEYFWDFGDGTDSYSAVPPPHTYFVPGTYAVAILAVTDERGAVGSDVIVITVTEPVNNPPVASPTATPETGDAPLFVQFAANASDADNDPLTYAWDFGDPSSASNTSTLANPTHTYAQAGTYVAWLTVSDGKNPVSYSLTITASPHLAFSVANASVKWAKKGTLANVDVVADFAAPVPAADDTIMMTFDGITLFAVPFSSFGYDAASGVYSWQGKTVNVSIDFAAGTVGVHTTKTVMTGFDAANGVEVYLMIGGLDAVENIAMTAVRGDRLVYQR